MTDDIEAAARECAMKVVALYYHSVESDNDATAIVATAMRSLVERETARLRHSCGGLSNPEPCGGCCECIDAQQTHCYDKLHQQLTAAQAQIEALTLLAGQYAVGPSFIQREVVVREMREALAAHAKPSTGGKL